MLSRLYDERVFTSSDDVVVSATTSRALLDAAGSTQRPSRRAVQSSAAQRRVTRDDVLAEEEEETKSDREGGVSSDDDHGDAPADDELEDEEDEEDEKRRTAGLQFPLQSPRHIAASQSYILRQQQRNGRVGGLASPNARRRHVKQLLNGDYNSQDASVRENTGGRDGVVTLAANGPLSKDLLPRKINVQYHDRPMELVYLSTGEIRARDECPPGLQLPATTDVRKLLEAPLSPATEGNAPHHSKPAFDASAASSTVHLTRQSKDADVVRPERWQRERPEVIETNGDTTKPMTRKSRKHQASPRNSSAGVDGTESEGDFRDADDRRDVIRSETRTAHANSSANRSHGGARTGVHPNQRTAQNDDGARAAKAGRLHSRRDEDGFSSEDEYIEEGQTHEPRQWKPSAGRNLEAELQKEKKRVLQKMTQLLEEQGKTQALQQQLQIFQDKVTAMERELETYARRGDANTSREDNRVRERDARIRELSEQVQSKDELVRRLQSQLEQSERLTGTHNRVEKSSTRYEDKISRLRQREAALAKQLEELMNRITDFHSQVECWKVNSREALEGCNKRTDVLELMDKLWLDFPPFIINAEAEAPSRKNSANGETSTIAFLTKKLRQKEEELRTTHVKYVELKELCARQCIREADLQNFINEHRLRGNLVIRKSTNDAGGARMGSAQDAENHNRRPNGQTNARDDRRYGNQDTDSNDGEGSESGDDQVVQRPRVFIDIKRSNQHDGVQHEQSPIEHVRLAPSPALAQRYRQQQQQQNLHPSVKQSTTRTGVAQSGRTTRATVSSASRTLATTRQMLTTRTSVTHKRAGTTVGARTPGVGRTASIASKARTSVTSRRPSQAPLTSRPWV